MSTKDITRFLLQPAKQYRGVRLQQGRPLLDSDYNEGARIREEDRRFALLDMFGKAACPDEGFTLGRPGPSNDPLLAGDTLAVETVFLNGVQTRVYPVSIRPGSIYVGGLRFELGEPEHIAFQRDYLQLKSQNLPAVIPIPNSPLLRSPPIPEPAETFHITLDDVPGGSVASVPLATEPGIVLPNFNIVVKRNVIQSPPTNSPDFPEFHFFYYLNAWEQAVTSIEDDEFQEKGLAGPDTSARIKRMRRVEVLSVPPGIDCISAFFNMLIPLLEQGNAVFDVETYELRSRGRLQLTFLQPDVATDCPPCTPDPGAKYLGTENQTLRIMQSSDFARDGRDAFVWTFDNAAPLYRVSVTGLEDDSLQGVRVNLLTQPKDAEHALRAGLVVEIIPFGAILEGAKDLRPGDPYFQKIADEMGVLVRLMEGEDGLVVDASDPARIQKLKELVWQWHPTHPNAAELNLSAPDGGRPFYMRMWHDAPDGVVELPLFTGENPPLGRTGIVPVFHRPGRRGDFWIATLRIDARNRIVPLDLMSDPAGVPPHGPRHFYAPLALVSGLDQEVATVEACCEQGRRITDRGCASRTVGDGVNSFGDFDNIQDAVDSLPLEGGFIEVRPGFYPHELSIQNRSNITIRGCGPNTLLQTPPSSPGSSLVTISESNGISLGNLAFNASGQNALQLTDVNEISFSELTVRAGMVVSGVFQPDPVQDNPLITITNANAVSFDGGRIENQWRQALVASSSSALRIRGFESHGTVEPIEPSALLDPIFSFASNVQGVVFADSSIEAFAQVCIEVASTDVELRRLILGARIPNNADVDPDARDSQNAISLVGAARVRIERCRITMDSMPDNTRPSINAALVVGGRDLTIEDNEIETLLDNEGVARAWGGLHVLGDSLRVEIRRNRIRGGLGHGITLGSALWTDGTNFVRRGPGFQQIADSTPPVVTGDFTTDGTRTPIMDPAVELLLIAENQIENMGTNGISSLFILGVEDELIDVRHAIIERNTIRNNLTQIPDPSASPIVVEVLPFGTGVEDASQSSTLTHTMDLEMRVLAHAGIALALATGSLEVRGNVIADNGTSELELPVNGIFVLIGDGIVIADNRIANNGGRPTSSDPATIRAGIRAGIAVMLAGPGTVTTLSDLRDRVGTTPDTEPQFVVEGGGTAARILNNTVQQPEGRALHVVGVGPISIESNFFSSRGNNAIDSDEARAQIGDVVFVQNLGSPWEAPLVPHAPLANLTGYRPAVSGWTNNYLVNEDLGSPNILFLGLGGPLSFQNNQVIYDWEIVQVPDQDETPVSFFPAALLSTDSVSVNANHFAQRLLFSAANAPPNFPGDIDEEDSPPIPGSDAPLLAQLLVIAATAQVVRNRFSADQKSVLLSLALQVEQLGIAVLNQCTYDILWNGPGDTTLTTLPRNASDPMTTAPPGNQILFRRNTALTGTLAFLTSHRSLLREQPPSE